jgi:hypothetical protein
METTMTLQSYGYVQIDISHLQELADVGFLLFQRDEKKKTLEMPADITAYIKSAENKVTLQASTLMPYHVAIQVMIPVSVEDMIAHIKANCVLPFDLGKEMVLNSFKAGPDDIVEMKKKLSLYDPLVLTRIQTPGRPKTCKHVQCFDLKNYLLMNERVRFVDEV